MRAPPSSLLRSPLFGALAECAVFGAGALNLAVFVGGAWRPHFDLLSNAAPALLLVGLVAWGAAHLAGARLVSAAALICATAPPALVLGAEALAAVQPPALESASSLKVLTLNVWSQNRDLAAVERLILRERPQVVLLQEVSGEASDELLKRLSRLYPAQASNNKHCAVHILSSFRVIEALRDAECDSATARLALPAKLGGGEILVASVHLPRSEVMRGPEVEAAELRADMARWAAGSAIVGGDFNRTPWSWSLRRFDEVQGMDRITHALPTWPTPLRARVTDRTSPFAILPIDHVYATKDWRVARVRRGPLAGSDHYPVIVELTRRSAAMRRASRS